MLGNKVSSERVVAAAEPEAAKEVKDGAPAPKVPYQNVNCQDEGLVDVFSENWRTGLDKHGTDGVEERHEQEPEGLEEGAADVLALNVGGEIDVNAIDTLRGVMIEVVAAEGNGRRHACRDVGNHAEGGVKRSVLHAESVGSI